MRKGPERRPRRAVALLAAFLTASTVWAIARGLEGCAQARGEGAGGRIVIEPSPLPRFMVPLLNKLWDLGFFRRNEAVQSEIQNNRYAFTDEGGPGVPPEKPGCYFQRQDGPDVIYLNKDMFSHFELSMEGLTERVNLIPQILPVLVHEICHDLWANVLDARERAAFIRESVELMTEYRMAQTPDEQRRFLNLAGEDPGDGTCLSTYSWIDGFLSADPPRGLCGQEAFAWLAERLFTTGAKIPAPLIRYYSSILAGAAPDRKARGR